MHQFSKGGAETAPFLIYKHIRAHRLGHEAANARDVRHYRLKAPGLGADCGSPPRCSSPPFLGQLPSRAVFQRYTDGGMYMAAICFAQIVLAQLARCGVEA